MSEQAPFVDGAAFNDQQNKNNTFLSYYTYGEAIALGLDSDTAFQISRPHARRVHAKRLEAAR
jgi:predicted metalloprotease with PDZ domain